MIVLDTNVLSEPLRSRPDDRVVAWLDAQSIETMYLTTPTLAEVRFGIAAMPNGQRKTMLHDRFEGEVVDGFKGRVLAFDESATTVYADLRVRARAAGVGLGDFDALIASIACVHGFAVATRDTRPFETAGLVVINPFE